MSALFRCREASQSTVIHCRALIAMCILLNLEEIMHVPELSLVVLRVKSLPAVQETWVRSLGWEDPLEKGMATHSSVLAWRIPRTEEAGGLYSPWGCKESDTTEQLTHTLIIHLYMYISRNQLVNGSINLVAFNWATQGPSFYQVLTVLTKQRL